MRELKKITVTNHRYRLGYHIMPDSGWINDPNGFSFFKGYYHLFYQHYPYKAEWGPMHWGHARSKDLVHWETFPIALFPGDPEDKDGCFSGSAVVFHEKLYLIYTGHHYADKNDPDHFWENQNLAYSSDGIHFEKYEGNPIISAPPADNTQHFRDPKVWQEDDHFNLVLGSQGENGLGRLLLYRSNDLKSWDYMGPLAQSRSLKEEGFMWECPDFFTFNGKDILLISPQGIQSTQTRFKNLYQTGYFIGHYHDKINQFDHGTFRELDSGHDFYATQTMIAPDGRRILIGWMAMWESQMPEKEDGWAGALTFPREITLRNNHIYMFPVRELRYLRKEQFINESLDVSRERTINFDGCPYLEADLVYKRNAEQEVGLILSDTKGPKLSVTFIEMEKGKTKVNLNRMGNDGTREATVHVNENLKIKLLLDKSSVEIFINEGEATFTERIYFENSPFLKVFSRGDNTLINIKVTKLENNAIQYL
ncbi:MAG: glycoside hydrolase family 32 protein [Sporolactobacillus sp.]